jgi:C-terminal processing protease CtpA/Prc
MTDDELSKYIKEESSGKIKMVVLRDDKEVEINLARGKVETPVVSSTIYEKNDKKIGYVGISIFSSGAFKQFENKLIELEKEMLKVRSLVEAYDNIIDMLAQEPNIAVDNGDEFDGVDQQIGEGNI